LGSDSAENHATICSARQRPGIWLVDFASDLCKGKPPANSQQMFPLFAITVVCRRFHDQHRCRGQKFIIIIIITTTTSIIIIIIIILILIITIIIIIIIIIIIKRN